MKLSSIGCNTGSVNRDAHFTLMWYLSRKFNHEE